MYLSNFSSLELFWCSILKVDLRCFFIILIFVTWTWYLWSSSFKKRLLMTIIASIFIWWFLFRSLIRNLVNLINWLYSLGILNINYILLHNSFQLYLLYRTFACWLHGLTLHESGLQVASAVGSKPQRCLNTSLWHLWKFRKVYTRKFQVPDILFLW